MKKELKVNDDKIKNVLNELQQSSKILMGAQKIRNSSDYDDFYIVSKEEAQNQIKNQKNL